MSADIGGIVLAVAAGLSPVALPVVLLMTGSQPIPKRTKYAKVDLETDINTALDGKQDSPLPIRTSWLLRYYAVYARKALSSDLRRKLEEQIGWYRKAIYEITDSEGVIEFANDEVLGLVQNWHRMTYLHLHTILNDGASKESMELFDKAQKSKRKKLMEAFEAAKVAAEETAAGQWEQQSKAIEQKALPKELEAATQAEESARLTALDAEEVRLRDLLASANALENSESVVAVVTESLEVLEAKRAEIAADRTARKVAELERQAKVSAAYVRTV